MSRKGICKNYANCEMADNDIIQEISDEEEFICQDSSCNKPLQIPDSGGVKEFKGPVKKRPWVAWCAGFGLLVFLYFIFIAIGSWMRGDPRIETSVSSMVFDFQQVGKGEGIREIYVKNVGSSGKLDIESLNFSSPEFFCRKTPEGIEPGKNTKLEILFKPTTPGQHDATLTINSDDVTQPKTTIRLSGGAGRYGLWWLWEQWEQTSQIFE